MSTDKKLKKIDDLEIHLKLAGHLNSVWLLSNEMSRCSYKSTFSVMDSLFYNFLDELISNILSYSSPGKLFCSSQMSFVRVWHLLGARKGLQI